jgi:16S rRNA (cytosine1402-N4)-methyltransferase
MHQQDQPHTHIPVLLEAVLQYLRPQAGDSYLDLTAGYGGHAKAIMERTGSHAQTTLVDRDAASISALQQAFAGRSVQIIHADFLSASRQFNAEGRQFDLMLADLGVSSPHLDDATRGFAFDQEGPLDMRMDRTQQRTAADIINTYSAEQLSDILKRYGEEPKAKQIARLVIEHRPITTTTELARIVARVWARAGPSKVHPATRTFQAIRIAVNDELSLLEQSLPLWIDLLAPGGRIAVLSFHSLEDRLVKRAFADAAGERYDARLRLLTKHPVRADKDEIVFNPRARSAKLRVAEKIKTM